MKTAAEKKNQKPLAKFVSERSDNMTKRPKRKLKKKKLSKDRFKEGAIAGLLRGFQTV